MKKIHVGTSGWSYDHWKENFYPQEVKAAKRLSFYAQTFDTVEINNTFYRLPSEKTVENWLQEVPENFCFSIKANQYITHRKRLKDGEQSTALFFERIAPFKKRLGALLFQLPPSFKKDLERLESFTRQLKGYDCAFEFRHASWFSEDTYRLLKESNCALCLADLKGESAPEERTADFIYIRLHGPHLAYQGSYTPKELQEWARKIAAWSKDHRIYCYFDNDDKGYAVKEAFNLKQWIAQII